MRIKVLLTAFFMLAFMLSINNSPEAKADLIQELAFKVEVDTYEPVALDQVWASTYWYGYGALVDLPFTFNFDNKDCDQAWILGGGQVYFIPNDGSPHSVPAANGPSPDYIYDYYNELTRHRLAAYAFTGYMTPAYTPGNMGVKDDGDCFIFQWTGYNIGYNSSTNCNWQIRIYRGSNKMEFIYGSMNRGSFNFGGSYLYEYKVGLSGVGNYLDRQNYVNVVPPNHPVVGNPDWLALYSMINPNNSVLDNSTVINNTLFAEFVEGLKITWGKGDPDIVGVIPGNGAILQLGEVYGTPYHPAMYITRTADQPEVSYMYLIGGPLPRDGSDYNVIYTAIENGDVDDELVYIDPQPVNPAEETPSLVRVQSAKGVAAQVDPNDGSLDLTNTDVLPGGEYEVKAELALGENDPVLWGYDRFIVALDYDIAINTIISPKKAEDNLYPFNAYNVPVRCYVTNVGLNPTYGFQVCASIWDPSGTLVYERCAVWEADPDPLTTGESKEIWLPNYRPFSVGNYRFTICVENLNPERDDNEGNNCMPRSYDDDYYFQVAHTIEASAEAIIAPQGNNFLRKPVDPMARFKNNGISNISDVPSTCEIYYLDADPPQRVYRNEILITDIPEGRFNTAIATYQTFIPNMPGLYRICATVNDRDDPIEANNTVCDSFYVVEAMSGEYTIGFENQGDARNFDTFQEAVDALYQIGVSGPVTFILTDAFYTIGLPAAPDFWPALDLSAKIVGVNEDNPILFKPSRERSIQRGAIELRLLSTGGIGIRFGQNVYPNNIYADVLDAGFFTKNQYANSEGYITFDGGPFKSIKVTMESESEFRAPFYMMEGTQNITLKNLIITNANDDDASYRASLPLTVLNQITSRFEFDDDIRGLNKDITYSAGVLLRSQVPIDPEANNNIYNLDTIPASHNTIENCDISGFGYGVVSLGMGILYKSGVGYNRYTFFPGESNVIRNNVIHDVSRAGIFLGFEHGTKVMNNRIYNITGNFNEASTKGTGGIIAGGDSYEGRFGYFNTELEIMGNEISSINGSYSAHGIKIENPELEFPDAMRGFIQFPDIPEANKIANNMIWGIKGIGSNVFRAGVHLLTQRQDPLDLMGTIFTPQVAKYYMRNDEIVNNTIILPGDASCDMTAAIAIQQTKGTKIYNNAIVTYSSNDNPDAITSALFLETAMPNDVYISINRNAYWTPENSSSSIAYFAELDNEDNTIIEISNSTDYQYIDQWNNWTGQDMYSVFGDFMSDYQYYGIPPTQKLRIKNDPIPQNSLLNNRGMNISWLQTDIDGDIRGTADQRFDIGADEFTGRMHVRDIEVTNITEPSVYKAGEGQFSDAEYVMLGHPNVEKFNVKAIVRNNGSLNQSAIKIYAKVYRMEPDGSWPDVPVIEDMAEVDLVTAESKEISFDLGELPNIDDALMTYSDLSDYDYPVPYTVPEQFTAMWNNVTPLHKVVVEVEPDEENNQNSLDKICRFYIMRAPMKIMISAVNTWQDLDATTPVDVIAGKLNYQSILNGMLGLGWFVNYDQGRVDFDIFDRTTWEPKAIDYTYYRSIIWSDGDGEEGTSGLTRLQRMDIQNFLNNTPVENEKKNLIISSQEMLRQSDDAKFNANVLRSTNVEPGNPMGLGVSNDESRARGNDIDKDYVQTILATDFEGDAEPYCGVLTISGEGEGIVKESYNWLEDYHPATGSDILGVTVNTFTRNLMFYAVDWRHWSNVERILRGSFDFVEKRNGLVIPVELYEFDARQVGNKVHVNWATASEYETDRFEVERAIRTDAGTTEFVKIAEEAAVGSTNETTQYGPVIDRNVTFGTTYVYRLKIVDLNGEYDHSDERVVNIGGSGDAWLGIAQPNPAATEVRFELRGMEDAQVVVYDIDGKVVTPNFTISGSFLELNLSGMNSGTYTMVVTSGENSLTRQFQIVK
jgi:hypothetical protein